MRSIPEKASQDFHPEVTPPEIRKYLESVGWTQSSEWPYWFYNEDFPALTWEQAMAIEYYKFVTIGGR